MGSFTPARAAASEERCSRYFSPARAKASTKRCASMSRKSAMPRARARMDCATSSVYQRGMTPDGPMRPSIGVVSWAGNVSCGGAMLLTSAIGCASEAGEEKRTGSSASCLRAVACSKRKAASKRKRSGALSKASSGDCAFLPMAALQQHARAGAGGEADFRVRPTAQPHGAAHEAVDAGMQSEETFQHRGEQEQPGALEGAGLKFKLDIEPAAEGAEPPTRHARRAGRGGDGEQGFQGGAGLGGVAQVVQAQHLLQRLRTFGTAGDGEMAEGEMRDEAPGARRALLGPQRGGGRGDAGHGGDTGLRAECRKARMAAAEGQLGRQIAVKAQRVDGQHRARLL